MHPMRALLGLSLWLAACTPAVNLTGQITNVVDGDTADVLLLGNERARVRLIGIDAPENGQPYADESRRALAELGFQKRVSIRYETHDDFGRILGRVRVGELDVNAEMVRRGAAWAYRFQGRATVPSFVALETAAREAGLGLWGLAAPPVAPWDWRRGVRTPPAEAQPAAEAFSCGAKAFCREMRSCDEARFHLTHCGLTTIDGDDDGMPCETICG